MQQLRFIWDHLGRLRKWILAGCLLMTRATDVLGWLPDRWKQHLEWLFPSWSWIWWLVILLSLVAAFVIEESYFREHPQQANPGRERPSDCPHMPWPRLVYSGSAIWFGSGCSRTMQRQLLQRE